MLHYVHESLMCTHSLGCSSIRPISRFCSACIHSRWCQPSQNHTWHQLWRWGSQHVLCRTIQLHTHGNLNKRGQTSVSYNVHWEMTLLLIKAPFCPIHIYFFRLTFKTSLSTVHRLSTCKNPDARGYKLIKMLTHAATVSSCYPTLLVICETSVRGLEGLVQSYNQQTPAQIKQGPPK